MIGVAKLLEFTIDNLYGGYVTNGKWNEQKYNQYLIARSALPLYSAYADVEIGRKRNDWYFNRYGMNWDDVIQPWNLPGTNQVESGYRSTLNYVSDNIKRLYK